MKVIASLKFVLGEEEYDTLLKAYNIIDDIYDKMLNNHVESAAILCKENQSIYDEDIYDLDFVSDLHRKLSCF